MKKLKCGWILVDRFSETDGRVTISLKSGSKFVLQKVRGRRVPNTCLSSHVRQYCRIDNRLFATGQARCPLLYRRFWFIIFYMNDV